MGPEEALGPSELRETVLRYRDALRLHQAHINRLNVYPVPDGDTGTNMALTLESVVAELAGGGDGMSDVCRAISHGSLMGARGNSGVILSQVLRGACEVLVEHDHVDGEVLASSLARATEAAYKAVQKPVEGTILTVVREVAEAVAEAATEPHAGLVAVLDHAREVGQRSLDRTPELLPVLAEAGVVDAGAAGFLLLIDAMLAVVADRPLPEPELVAEGAGVLADVAAADNGVSELRYEVMYLLEAPDDAIDGFRDVWAGIGDSIAVVGGDGIWNCHIHTDDIGAAIEAAVDCGRPRDIRVTDLHEQMEEERWVREAELPSRPSPQEVPTAVVAVAAGAGIHRIFHSLGVQVMVSGGQTMNPSTAQLLAAVDSAPAPEVVILPNNKNIVPVAEQVAELSEKRVFVVPTHGVTEGFASLLAYDPQADAAANAGAMEAAAHAVVAGEVTRAVRDSVAEVGKIAEGDFMGISRSGIVSVSASLPEAATGLLEALVGPEHEIVTVIEGEGATAADTRLVTEWLRSHREEVEVEVHHGGQRLYPYYFGIE